MYPEWVMFLYIIHSHSKCNLENTYFRFNPISLYIEPIELEYNCKNFLSDSTVAQKTH